MPSELCSLESAGRMKWSLVSEKRVAVLAGIIVLLDQLTKIIVLNSLVFGREERIIIEVFFCGTAAEVTPIRSVDRVKVGRGRRGPITEAIQQRFFQIVKGGGAGPARLAPARQSARTGYIGGAQEPIIRR